LTENTNIERVFSDVLNCCFEVHKNLGPGLLENVYKCCLEHELKSKGFKVEIEKPLPINYKNVELDCGYRLDVVVEDKIVLELKSIDKLNDLHLAQIITYMKLSHLELGLLINFNTKLLKNGIKRVRL